MTGPAPAGAPTIADEDLVNALRETAAEAEQLTGLERDAALGTLEALAARLGIAQAVLAGDGPQAEEPPHKPGAARTPDGRAVAVWDAREDAVRFPAFAPLLADFSDLPLFRSDLAARRAFILKVIADVSPPARERVLAQLEATAAEAELVARWFELLAEQTAARLVRALAGAPAGFDEQALAGRVRRLVGEGA